MNLTDRQVELIRDLLISYEAYRKCFINENGYEICDDVDFVFNGISYSILEPDYDNVCEIIDYIKGVNK